MWSISCNIQHLVHQQNQHKIQWSMLCKRTFRHYRQANFCKWMKLSTIHCHQANKRKCGLEAEWLWALGALCRLRYKKKLAAGKCQETHLLSNQEKEQWIEDYVEREIAVARKQVEDAEAAIKQVQDDMRNPERRDWQPPHLKQHWRRCWMPSEIAWAILQVLTMRRMGNTRMMMRKILRGASLVKMTNLAGWWAQSPKRYSIAWSVFGRSRWSIPKWRNHAGETQPIASVRVIRSTGWPNGMFRLSFNLKRQMNQHQQRQQHLVRVWRLLMVSPENCKCRELLFDQGVVICGLVCRKRTHTNAIRPHCPPECLIRLRFRYQSISNPSALTTACRFPC